MSYVDGFLAAVPLANKDAYIAHAKQMQPVLREFGVIGGWECWGDDLPDGKLTDFRMAVKAEPGERIVFSWVTWPDRATADASHDKMMADPRMAEQFGDGSQMPFDGKRMIHGGFEPLVWKDA